jgi:hypothetical protein
MKDDEKQEEGKLFLDTTPIYYLIIIILKRFIHLDNTSKVIKLAIIQQQNI